VFAKDEKEARDFALELNIDDMNETGEEEAVINSCELSEDDLPVLIRWEDVN
jgi:hypothetical protein